jgi:hypothetical protein
MVARRSRWREERVGRQPSPSTPKRRLVQIDATYGHLVPDSEEYLRGLLDAYDHSAAEAVNLENG